MISGQFYTYGLVTILVFESIGIVCQGDDLLLLAWALQHNALIGELTDNHIIYYAISYIEPTNKVYILNPFYPNKINAIKTNLTMELQHVSNKLSRRNWLRDAAIAATSVTVVPSFFVGCTDHRLDPGNGSLGGSLGSEPTLEELEKAAQNLMNMKGWIDEVYSYNKEYEDYVHNTLLSGPATTELGSFVVDVFVAIAIGIITAAAEVATAGAATAAIAIAGASINKFAIGNDIPTGLEGVIADFEKAQLTMRGAITGMLEHLADPKPNNTFKNLKDAFKAGAIEFNQKPYTLSDLVNADFPSTGDEYLAMREAARNKFKKYIWNVVIVKVGKMYEGLGFAFSPYLGISPTKYGLAYYKQNPATYLRGITDCYPCSYIFHPFYVTIDGHELSADAAAELFIDDTPGHIMNPDDKGNPTTGLFPRDYVFKQFHREKPDFLGTLDLRKDSDENADPYENFDPSTLKYDFTGGELKLK